MNKITVLSLNIITMFLLTSCSSSDVTKSITADERFEMGKKLFDDEDYLEAIHEFEIVKIQFPGSTVADDAQYYLAESRYKMEEYLLAAQEYQELTRNMSASSFIPLAQFKVGMCYYNLSPSSSLDQQYTHRAIDEFQSFIEYHPTHELAQEATANIKKLNENLAKKLYETAELYMNMEYYKSATIYFNNVIEKFHDTPFAENAYLGKVRALILRKKYSDAGKEINKYFEKYPSGLMKNAAENLKKQIDGELESNKSNHNQ
ncbi:MAG: outer membrane protein assembly factor BamD [Ignavibacteriales bacterium]|nr:outer membrane protein assembly factor BamD [Ignavibacteriales bacterium]